MTRSHLRFLRNEFIEDVTALRIREYESKHGITVQLPVPIEEIVEQVLGLDFDWDVIEEPERLDALLVHIIAHAELQTFDMIGP